MSEKTIKIYALVNPVNKCVFYIGASVNPKGRVTYHVNEGLSGEMNFKSKQIRLIVAAGEYPELKILETCSAESATSRENFWISYFKANGHKILQANNSDYSAFYAKIQAITMSKRQCREAAAMAKKVKTKRSKIHQDDQTK